MKYGLLLLCLSVAVIGCGKNYESRTSDFLDEMKSGVDPGQLQNWAMQEIAFSTGKTTEITQYPSFLSGSSFGSPKFAVVHQDGNESYLQLYWGDGFGHWGLVIGDQSFIRTSGASNYYKRWEPGIYAWHEIQ